MLNLLKQKTRVSIAQKSRKKYDVLLPAKRMKPNPDEEMKGEEAGSLKPPTSQSQMRRNKITPTIIERYNEKE